MSPNDHMLDQLIWISSFFFVIYIYIIFPGGLARESKHICSDKAEDYLFSLLMEFASDWILVLCFIVIISLIRTLLLEQDKKHITLMFVWMGTRTVALVCGVFMLVISLWTWLPKGRRSIGSLVCKQLLVRFLC